jgi:predicted Zn-dependent peptidase
MGALGVGITALSDRADAAIGLLGEIVTKATFPVADVARILANETHEREARDEAPRAIAERLLPMALYGWSHPDDEQWSLRKEDLGTLTRDDLLNAYESAFDPSTATLVVVGDTTEEALRSVLGRVFGSWTRRKRPTPGRVFPP